MVVKGDIDIDLTTAIFFRSPGIHIGQIALSCFGFFLSFIGFFFASKFCYVFITINASKVP